MTSAPACLKEARSFLLSTFDLHPGVVASDLDPDEVGIVPDAAHRGGYHCGSDRTISGDYSVVESSRDRVGLTGDASALDVGQFAHTFANGTKVDLRHFSNWCVAQCRAGAFDTLDIREIIYSPDGVTVKRWDRLGKRSSGDSSHKFHTHFSQFRDATKASRRTLLALFRRYVATFSAAGTPAQTESAPATPTTPVPPKEHDVTFISKDAAGNYYKCDGIWSRPVPAGKVGDALYIAKQLGYVHVTPTPQTAAEWGDDGWTRLGWSEDICGKLIGAVTLSDAQVAAIADRLVAATDNPLGDADKPAIVAAVKQALSEGSAG